MSWKARLAILAAAALIAGGLWLVRGHEEGGSAAWEYATVEAFAEYTQYTVKVSVANVCYHVSGGCRWDTVRVTVDKSGDINDAVAAATARLGERGWEAVSFTAPSDYRRAAVLMKRRRAEE
jgi:hypothetical protein